MATAVSAARERRHQDTRAEILTVAWRLAERDGIAALSLRELARLVGMQAPSLYTYFPSKAAIYDAMFADSYTEMLRKMDAIEPDPSDRVGFLARTIEWTIDYGLASLPRYHLMFTYAIPGWAPSPEAYAASVAVYQRSGELLARIGVEGQDALDLLTALVAGLMAQQVANDPAGDRWRRRSRDAAEMFLHHIERTQ